MLNALGARKNTELVSCHILNKNTSAPCFGQKTNVLRSVWQEIRKMHVKNMPK